MAAPASYSRRSYVGNAAATTIPLGLGSSDGSCALASGTNWPSGSGGDFLVVIDRGQNSEEKAWCSATSGTILTFAQRGAEGTGAVSHGAGCTIALCIGSMDGDEANQVVSQVLGQASAAKGDILAMLSAAGPNTLTRIPIGSTGQVLSATSGGLPAWATVPSPTLGQIEGFFTASNQILLGTGSASGTLASLTSGYGITGFVANPPAPAVTFTTVTSFITSNVSLTSNTAANVTSASLPAGTWLVNGQACQVSSSAGSATEASLWFSTTSAGGTALGGNVGAIPTTAVETVAAVANPNFSCVVVSSSATYYLNAENSSANGSVAAQPGSLNANVVSGFTALRIG